MHTKKIMIIKKLVISFTLPFLNFETWFRLHTAIVCEIIKLLNGKVSHASHIIILTFVTVAVITPSFFFLVRRNPFEVFFKKDVLQICCKFTGEHLYRSVISIKLHTAYILVFDKYFCILELLQAILQDPHKRFSY